MAIVELVLAIIGGWCVASLMVGGGIVVWRRAHIEHIEVQPAQMLAGRRRDAA